VSRIDETDGENIMGNGFVFEAITPADQELIRVYVQASMLADTWTTAG
jgi:hypothetical protein